MTIAILRTAATTNHQFTAGALTFQPSEARSAIELYETLPDLGKTWFEKQSLMRMVLLGRANKAGPPPRSKDT